MRSAGKGEQRNGKDKMGKMPKKGKTEEGEKWKKGSRQRSRVKGKKNRKKVGGFFSKKEKRKKAKDKMGDSEDTNISDAILKNVLQVNLRKQKNSLTNDLVCG